MFVTFLFSLFSSRELGCSKTGNKSDRRSRHSTLPYGILYNFFSTVSTFLGNQKIAGKSSHNIRVGLWAFLNEGGMCPVLLTEKTSVKDTGSWIQSAPVEELLQNNEQQQVLLETEVRRTLLQIPSRLQLVNAKGHKRPVQKLARWHQLKRISETCQGLDNWHHILCFASKWSWAHHLGTHMLMSYSTWVWRWMNEINRRMREYSLVSGRQVLKLKILWFIFCLWTLTDLRGSFAHSSLQTVQQICTTFPGTGTGTLPSCLQHTELCNIQSWFTHISGPADNFWVSSKCLKLAYKELLIYWRAFYQMKDHFQPAQNWPTQILSQKWQSVPLLCKKEMSRDLRKRPENTMIFFFWMDYLGDST